MNKRKAHHYLGRLKFVSVKFLIGLFILSLIVSALALRENNLTALELRDKVLVADKNNKNVEEALVQLREYTHSHMNANLASDTGIYPPIQLKYTYDRLVRKEQKRVERENSDVYSDAQKYCEETQPESFFGAGRIACITSYIERQNQPEAEPEPIPDSLYKFDFVAPVWSPDFAGWSIVASAVILLLLILRILAGWWLSYQAHKGK